MINVIGQFFGTSGYAKHTRYLVNELDKLEDVRMLTNLPTGWERDTTDKELQMFKRGTIESYDTNLIITHPAHWRANCWAKQNIVYLVWEGDRVPWWIVEECMNENIHKIIVPSKHVYDALFNSTTNKERSANELLLKKKVHIIPHGVDLDIFKPLTRQTNPSRRSDTLRDVKIEHPVAQENLTSLKKDKAVETFKFLAVKGFTNMQDRGGIQYLIKAFCEEFKDEQVELIIKLNAAYGIPQIDKMFDLKEAAPIKLITDNLTNERMNELYNSCDVFVSPTRGEAFNLPCLEALACGKPVITTNFGGQTDFMHNDELGDSLGWLVDYKLEEVEHDLEYEGIKWATPSMKDLKKQMRTAYNFVIKKPNTQRYLWSSCISRAKEYTWKSTAKQVHNVCTHNRKV